jgi:hypothetical protein
MSGRLDYARRWRERPKSARDSVRRLLTAATATASEEEERAICEALNVLSVAAVPNMRLR